MPRRPRGALDAVHGEHPHEIITYDGLEMLHVATEYKDQTLRSSVSPPT